MDKKHILNILHNELYASDIQKKSDIIKIILSLIGMVLFFSFFSSTFIFFNHINSKIIFSNIIIFFILYLNSSFLFIPLFIKILPKNKTFPYILNLIIHNNGTKPGINSYTKPDITWIYFYALPFFILSIAGIIINITLIYLVIFTIKSYKNISPYIKTKFNFSKYKKYFISLIVPIPFIVFFWLLTGTIIETILTCLLLLLFSFIFLQLKKYLDKPITVKENIAKDILDQIKDNKDE